MLFRRRWPAGVAHRVVETFDREGGDLLVTRGDRQRATDSPISNEELLGRLTKVLRGNRGKVPRLNFAAGRERGYSPLRVFNLNSEIE